MKIETLSRSKRPTIRLIGRFQATDIGELKEQLEAKGPHVVLDMKEVTLVDVDVVRFLGLCEDRGVKIVHCSQYIQEWIRRERKR